MICPRPSIAHTVRPYRTRAILRLLSLAFVLLFAVQGTLVQAHVHFPAPLSGGAPNAQSGAAQPSHAGRTGKTPAPDEGAGCALCLAITLVGAYSLPAVTPIYQPTFFAPLERAFLFQPFANFSLALAWQSRAPPVALIA